VRRHFGATRVDIRLSLSPDEVVCEVADDGKGCAREEMAASRRGRDALRPA